MAPDALLQGFLAQARDHAFILIDRSAHIVGWEAGAENVFGHPRDQILGQHMSVLFTPQDVTIGAWQHELDVAADYGKSEDDRWMLRRNQARFWASGVVTAIHDGGGALLGFSKVMRDRTDVRTQVQNLHNRLEAAERAVRDKDAFMGSFAHELRTPLSSFSFGLEIVRRTLPIEHAGDKTLDMMRRQVDFMSGVIGNLLDLTRLQAGKTVLTLEHVSLRSVVDRAIETCGSLLSGNGHEPRVIFPPADIVLEADATLLQQVLVNLVCNAAKYTEKPSPIWVFGTIEGHEAVIRVRDHGRGIPPPMIPHIFEMFTQVGPDIARSESGLGIGLAVVKQLVELHGGTVTARSEGEGLGSEFSIRVPLIQGEHRHDDSDRSNP